MQSVVNNTAKFILIVNNNLDLMDWMLFAVRLGAGSTMRNTSPGLAWQSINLKSSELFNRACLLRYYSMPT